MTMAIPSSSGVIKQSMMRQLFPLLVNFKKRPSRSSRQAGFTLTEALVVVILAGVLAAIAAPGWLTFANRQRVSSANKELLQLIREAQAEAIAKRTTYGVLLKPNEAGGPAVTKFTAKGQDLADATQIVEITTETLGSEGEDTGLELTTVPNNNTNQYRFDFDGSVNNTFIPAAPAGADYVYKIQVSKDGTRNCVIVETLLGAISEGSGDECDA